jgi:signal transduction histidine kinase
VACRRRIRYKLMLAIGVVIALVGLLTGGTFLGLRSYQLTVRNFESKLLELDEANRLRLQVNKLYSSASDPSSQAPQQFMENLAGVRQKLQDYQQKLDETLQQNRAVDKGLNEKLQVEALREILGKLQSVVDEQAQNNFPQFEISTGGRKPLMALEAVKTNLDNLVLTADDLNGAIYKGFKERIESSRKDYNMSSWIVGSVSAGGVLILMGLLWRFYRWVFYPIRDLERGAVQIAQGNFDLHIEVHSGDEMEELANAFNHMTRRLRDIYADLNRQVNERSRQLVRSERLASVGYLAAGVAHEINNPLASIVFCSEALEHRLNELLDQAQRQAADNHRAISPDDRETMTRYLKMVQTEAMRCKQITQRLLEFSRGGEKRRESADLTDIVQGVLDTVQHLPNAKDKHIVFQPTSQLTAWVNGQEIKSVVLNLVVNSLESMDEGGTLTITQRQVDGMATLMFQDTGCGMPREVLDNIFEPFFTRSRTGKGTGLGLSISHRIITQHGGEIEASSPGPNRGSTFVVRLPLKPPSGGGQRMEENGSVESSEETYYLRKLAA